MKLYNKIVPVRELLDESFTPRASTREAPEELMVVLEEKLPRSLTMEVSTGRNPSSFQTFYSQGYKGSKFGKSWDDRFDVWLSTNYWLFLEYGCLYTVKMTSREYFSNGEVREFARNNLLPLFGNHYKLDESEFGNETVLESTINQNTVNFKEKDNMKNYFKKLNTDAAKTTAQLSVGKAANQTVAATLARTFPWYARLFGKHREMVDNPIARLATAEAVAMAAKQFAPGNDKLQYVAEAMVLESMADLALNSSVMKATLEQLEALAEKLPNFDSKND